MKDNRSIDQVPGTDYRIIQDKSKFSYGTDAIFISEFAKPKGVTVDLGTGTGIIAIRIAGRKKIDKIYGLEIQEEMADMARESIALNGLEDKIEIINMDFKEVENYFEKDTIDTVISNPPYMKLGGALINEEENFAISRHELKASLEDLIKAADYLLRPRGRFYMVHRPDRLVDIFYLMRKYRIEPKTLKMVQSRLDSKPNLVLIEGIKHAKAELRMEETLIIYKDDLSYTEELKDIYYKEVE